MHTLMDNLWALTQRNRIDKFLAFRKSDGVLWGPNLTWGLSHPLGNLETRTELSSVCCISKIEITTAAATLPYSGYMVYGILVCYGMHIQMYAKQGHPPNWGRGRPIKKGANEHFSTIKFLVCRLASCSLTFCIWLGIWRDVKVGRTLQLFWH